MNRENEWLRALVNKRTIVSQRDNLLQVAEARLHPSLTNPNFLVLRSRRLIFVSWINQIPGRGLNVLDVGGRYQPYRPLLQHKESGYIGVDVIPTVMVDVVASGESLPFAANTFDVVIATQVFEYFSKPSLAGEQIHRVLKPGGCLLASLASFAPRFVDDERWRFTPAGIRLVFSPFANVNIVPELSNIGSFLRTINLAMNAFLPWSFARFAYNWTIGPILNILGLGLESLRLTRGDQFAANYSVRATKAN